MAAVARIDKKEGFASNGNAHSRTGARRLIKGDSGMAETRRQWRGSIGRTADVDAAGTPAAAGCCRSGVAREQEEGPRPRPGKPIGSRTRPDAPIAAVNRSSRSLSASRSERPQAARGCGAEAAVRAACADRRKPTRQLSEQRSKTTTSPRSSSHRPGEKVRGSGQRPRSSGHGRPPVSRHTGGGRSRARRSRSIPRSAADRRRA